jgi:glycosyltransferase involved in cell wall biosynthesis
MHVLLIPENYPSWRRPTSGLFFQDQAQALAELGGHRMGVICPQSLSWKNWLGQLGRNPQVTQDNCGVTLLRAPMSGFLARWPRLYVRSWKHHVSRLFTRYLREFGRPDIIHAHWAVPSGIAAATISETYEIPFVVTEHSSGYLDPHRLPGAMPQLALKAFKKAAAVVMVSEPFGRRVEEFLGPDMPGWQTIPNLIGTEFERDEALAIRPASEQFEFLFVGSLSPRKGVDLLVDAFERAFGHRSGISLTLVGEGPLALWIDKTIKERGLAGWIRRTGPLDRSRVMAEIMRCDALVLPSTFEPFGVVCIEAMACGRPVLATRCGGPQDILDKDSGLLVEAESLEALVQGLKKMYLERSKFDPVRIRTSCLQRFSRKVVVGKLTDLYQETLQSSRDGK